jgi:hypothetical protein
VVQLQPSSSHTVQRSTVKAQRLKAEHKPSNLAHCPNVLIIERRSNLAMEFVCLQTIEHVLPLRVHDQRTISYYSTCTRSFNRVIRYVSSSDHLSRILRRIATVEMATPTMSVVGQTFSSLSALLRVIDDHGRV